MISLRPSLLGLAALCALLTMGSTSCNKPQASPTIRLWHFWSEPRQTQVLDSLLRIFEEQHPGVHIEATALQWSDGKAKLQTAFASSSAPDIIHIGLEWVEEFASASVLDSLPDDLLARSIPRLHNAVKLQGKMYALPWTMNCRALFVDGSLGKALSRENLQPSLDDYERMLKNPAFQSLRVGVNSYEPHNVLKKTLPFLWAGGSRIMTSLPFSSTIDSEAIAALESYASMCKNGRMESSRTLDDALAGHELGLWPSGMWNLASPTTSMNYQVADRWPAWSWAKDSALTGWSILSADCWALTSSSQHKEACMQLLRFLSSSTVQVQFCRQLPDAGFPAAPLFQEKKPVDRSDSSVYAANTNIEGFYSQCLRSRPLPSTPYFLDAEAEFEQQIMQVLYEKKSPREAMRDLQIAWSTIEAARRH